MMAIALFDPEPPEDTPFSLGIWAHEAVIGRGEHSTVMTNVGHQRIKSSQFTPNFPGTCHG